MPKPSVSNANQLVGSIDKLFHYLLVYVKRNTTVTCRVSDGTVYQKEFEAPSRISISPTLFTRLDGCHGAGNCCRVPFDLVYTEFDRSRIQNYDYELAVDSFGVESADRFLHSRDHLLESLERLDVVLSDKSCTWARNIWVKKNHTKNPMSGANSCTYLFMGEDRYFCSAHPFKPLHCWYPHMTVRVSQSQDIIAESLGGRPGSKDRPTVSIGRMQYGRNHKFGCPVIFTETIEDPDERLFAGVGEQMPSYFASQFIGDVEKLRWTSDSAESLGFNSDRNFAVGIHEQFRSKETAIRHMLSSGKTSAIPLWSAW